MIKKLTQTRAFKKWAKIIGYSVGVLFLAYLVLPSFPGLTSPFEPFLARAEVALCSHAPNKSNCYELNVPRLMWIMPVTNIFQIIRDIQVDDRSYQFCHVLAHNLGQDEVAKDPDAWVSLMHKNPPDSLCSNGYIHGIIVGRFNKTALPQEQIDTIEPDLADACEPAAGWKPTDLDRAMCYHGMGHVLTFITSANLPLAVSYCKQIAVKTTGQDYSQTCISGVFMQIFQPLEPEDFELIARLPVQPTRDNLAQFCGSYATEEERSLCFGEGWPLFHDDLQTASGVQKFCTTTSDPTTQVNCYRTALSIGARGSLGNPAKQSAVCAALPLKLGQECFGILAEAFVEENRTEGPAAAAVCAAAGAPYKESCFGYVVRLVDFAFGTDSTDRAILCAALPPNWQEQCTIKR